MKTQEVILSAFSEQDHLLAWRAANAALPSDESAGSRIVSVSAEDHLVVIEGFLARKAY